MLSNFSFRSGRSMCIYSRFKRAMCISYQPRVDVHKG